MFVASAQRMYTNSAMALIVALAALATAAVPAAAQTAASAAKGEPGAGFADPDAAPRRPPPADIEPVLRGPSIDTLATVRKRGVLRVGVVSSEPMAMHDKGGEWVGFSVDLVRRLASDLGVGVEFVPSGWANVIPDLLDRQFDLIASGLWVTVPRALVVNFSNPTAVEGIYLVANQAKAAGRKTIADFNKPGVTIAVYPGSVQEQVAQRLFPRATLLSLKDTDELGPLLKGRAHALLLPTLAPQLVARVAQGQLVLPLAEPLARASAAFAVRKGDPDFVSFLNTWLAVQREQGWLDERASYWSTSTDWLK
jgi:polar amino acid transport system substrate-binding protein